MVTYEGFSLKIEEINVIHRTLRIGDVITKLEFLDGDKQWHGEEMKFLIDQHKEFYEREVRK